MGKVCGRRGRFRSAAFLVRVFAGGPGRVRGGGKSATRGKDVMAEPVVLISLPAGLP